MSSTNQTHTPEPWLVEKYGRGYSVYTQENDYRIIADCKARDGCELGSCEANAHLIASAPDMLAACEAALKYLDANRPKGGIHEIFTQLNQYENDVMKPLRAAIRKARNQSKGE